MKSILTIAAIAVVTPILLLILTIAAIVVVTPILLLIRVWDDLVIWYEEDSDD